ncbi:phycobiliprotein lyase or activator/ similar to CotB [Synechococcus sp. MEDNS5]|uniref:HEAT repeat domain-containing protein n=1 Tax=Synechococcus sp. MEDNS5 TaxID=1442554 RepID=UPI00164812A4|nr:HEAT repeat domain-containing protein [Synechococcus sp. MEDNS5]QNJ04896.1 phycobiliprotein lyase or activator/ similar to CotB [Synechococcus sp. MEDNS5]
MASSPQTPPGDAPDLDALREAIASGDPTRAMPALTQLRFCSDEEAVPLLVLGTQQQAFLVRSLSCSGLGYKRTDQGWTVLEQLLGSDEDANVRAEAANALVSYGVVRSWPLLRAAFAADGAWLVRCSILSGLAEQPEINLAWLLELAEIAIADGDGTVRVSGAEILGRIVRESQGIPIGEQARALLQPLQQDQDHRVVAAALNGLQGG